MSALKCQPIARTVEFESRGIVIPDKYPYCISMEWYILKILSGYQMSLHTEPKKHWQLNQQWAKGYETSLQSLSMRHGTRCMMCHGLLTRKTKLKAFDIYGDFRCFILWLLLMWCEVFPTHRISLFFPGPLNVLNN